MSDLASQQKALVAALTGRAVPPTGFDPDAVRAAADALLHKRCREVARYMPVLATALGPRLYPAFADWAATRPETTIAADAEAFARHVGAGTSTTGRRWFSLRRRRT